MRNYQTRGITSPENSLPTFYAALRDKMTFPLGWRSCGGDPAQWRSRALAKAKELMVWDRCDLPFSPAVVAEEDRGSYVAKKVAFDISDESRALAYLLVPTSAPARGGPFPAALMLHDHGGTFDIGKEKCVRPFADADREGSAKSWVERAFGSRFLGDELARRGWVVLSFDALGWGDRSCPGYRGDSQQALASNLLNLGSSYGALIAQEDIRAAEFLASLPEVDATRVCAVGFSMGAFRAWQAAALSDAVTSCVANCWMATMRGLMVEGNNQLKGQSAFTMTHPGLGRWLDYPDVAALAAPKPMLVYAGRSDRLFPVEAVEDAFAKLSEAYAAFGAADRLTARFWDGGHVFDVERQDAMFDWLERLGISDPGSRGGRP